jgi:NadR type nicotinamide-nucleotide adenylyltransferase
MKRGLVVGKFWPPHRGHQHLIETARAGVEQLYVMLCRRPHESPAGELRIAWLRELYPDVNFLLIDDTLGDDDSEGWAENSIRCLGFVPDAVFTSEDYGEPFAFYLGCQHVLVDKAREAVPVSGTRVRADPLGNWEYLSPPVRGHYAKRICLVGAESTGKTTLAQQLATHYKTNWVPEYGRAYCELKFEQSADVPWRSGEFIHIARTQCQHENAAAREANKLLICDTDAFATSIWHQRYMGHRSAEVEALVQVHRRPDLYLVPDVDTPFVQDGTRDGEAIREWMHDVFIRELTSQNRPFQLLCGAFEERFIQAIAYIDEVLVQRQDAK